MDLVILNNVYHFHNVVRVARVLGMKIIKIKLSMPQGLSPLRNFRGLFKLTRIKF